MIIHPPDTHQQDGHILVWSKIELDQARNGIPEYLWYRLPERYAHFVSMQSDAFLIPALLVGMQFGEDIDVCGPVSPRLAYHLEEYQTLLHLRMPEDVNPVNIRYDDLSPGDLTPKSVGATFSGGADSLFTLWKHLPQNQSNPDYQITHTIFIHGFDIPNRDKVSFKFLFDRYESQLRNIGIELIPIETNLVSLIIPRLEYRYFYGPVLAGCAHILGGLFRRFYIPSSRSYDQLLLRESSSSASTDYLLSTDSMEIIHHGATYQRVAKIQEIADWEFGWHNLRVCHHAEFDNNLLNCSRCEKCVRTMIPLFAIDKLDQFRTFRNYFKEDRDVLIFARKFNPTTGYNPELMQFAREHKPNLVIWLRMANWLGYIRFRMIRLIPEWIKQRLQRFGYFVSPFREEYAFDDLDIIQTIRTNQTLYPRVNKLPATTRVRDH